MIPSASGAALTPAPPGDTIGQLIKRLREERHLSIAQLANQTGLSANAIRWIERGVTQPKPESLRSLAAILGFRYQEMLGRAGYLDQSDEDQDEKQLLELYRGLSPDARTLLREVLEAVTLIAQPHALASGPSGGPDARAQPE